MWMNRNSKNITKKRILEAVTAMTSEKYLKLVFYFAKACYREEKEKET